MTLIEHLRGWDEMPEDDSEAFRWLDLKTAEAADELEFLQQQLAGALNKLEMAEACLAGDNALIAGLKNDLAAAIAACKLKDEALKWALPDCISLIEYWSGKGSEDTSESVIAIKHALAIQPDDSALKVWLGEPVAWLHETRHDSDVITDAVKNVWNGVVVGKMAQYSIPLYSPKGLK